MIIIFILVYNKNMSQLTIPELKIQIPSKLTTITEEKLEKIQHIILMSKDFSQEKILRYQKYGKVLVFAEINTPYPISKYIEFDYILIDVSKDINLRWFEAQYKSIPESTEISARPYLLEKYEWDENIDKNSWLSFADNILDNIPTVKVFKEQFDMEHVKSKILRSSLGMTALKGLCSICGLKK